VQLDEETTAQYVRHAFTQLLAVADRLGDDLVSARPLGPQTNSVAGLVVHSCGMAEFWLGHVALGRASDRDREAEFRASAGVADLRALGERSLHTVLDDLRRIEAGEAEPGHEARAALVGGPSDASLVLHVLEELYQHLGHAELAADALLTTPGRT
jgi:hypothetical protein